jgi:hypothetical protein
VIFIMDCNKVKSIVWLHSQTRRHNYDPSQLFIDRKGLILSRAHTDLSLFIVQNVLVVCSSEHFLRGLTNRCEDSIARYFAFVFAISWLIAYQLSLFGSLDFLYHQLRWCSLKPLLIWTTLLKLVNQSHHLRISTERTNSARADTHSRATCSGRHFRLRLGELDRVDQENWAHYFESRSTTKGTTLTRGATSLSFRETVRFKELTLPGRVLDQIQQSLHSYFTRDYSLK